MTILPKGELAGEENTSKMIKAESKKNAYFFDYEAKTPGQPLVRLYCVLVPSSTRYFYSHGMVDELD